MVQFRLLFLELHHFEKNVARHLSLIGRHLESVGRTEPVFELNLALSEKRQPQVIQNLRACSDSSRPFSKNVVTHM